jgi:hypothetical protein
VFSGVVRRFNLDILVDLDRNQTVPAVVSVVPSLPVRFGIANCAVERVSEKKQNEYPAFAPFTAGRLFRGRIRFSSEVLLDPFCRGFSWVKKSS